MSDLIFTFGLTNQETLIDPRTGKPAEWMSGRSDNPMTTRETYNLFRQVPEIEEDSISWKLNMSNPYVVHLINLWERIIRVPHLKMCNVDKIPFELNPEWNSTRLELDVRNLIPLPRDVNTELDLAKVAPHLGAVSWGDLELSITDVLSRDDYTREIVKGFNDKDIDAVPHIVSSNIRFPIMLVSRFNLKNIKSSYAMNNNIAVQDKSMQEFVQENQEALSKKGYTQEIIDAVTSKQAIKVGEIIGDPSEAFEKSCKYKYICRASLTEG